MLIAHKIALDPTGQAADIFCPLRRDGAVRLQLGSSRVEGAWRRLERLIRPYPRRLTPSFGGGSMA